MNLTPLRWETLPEERLSPSVARQVVWGRQSTLSRVALAKGAYISRHQHVSEQITYLLRGAMRMSIAGEEVYLQAGDLLVIPSDLEHEAWILEDTVVLDFFAPAREDWKQGHSQYLAGR
ncbi:MAG: cupin domain-containing protein [Acidobacteria bacterium]|nr:cupin domain-containing protein [Acidobacteriota bacterium]